MKPSENTARRSDPASSREMLSSLTAEDMRRVLEAAKAIEVAGFEFFSDSDLALMLERTSGRVHPRNVVAKNRQNLEVQGYVDRYCDDTGKPILQTSSLFPGNPRKVLSFYMTPKGHKELNQQTLDL